MVVLDQGHIFVNESLADINSKGRIFRAEASFKAGMDTLIIFDIAGNRLRGMPGFPGILLHRFPFDNDFVTNLTFMGKRRPHIMDGAAPWHQPFLGYLKVFDIVRNGVGAETGHGADINIRKHPTLLFGLIEQPDNGPLPDTFGFFTVEQGLKVITMDKF